MAQNIKLQCKVLTLNNQSSCSYKHANRIFKTFFIISVFHFTVVQLQKKLLGRNKGKKRISWKERKARWVRKHAIK